MRKELEKMLKEKFNFNYDGEDDGAILYSCITNFDEMNFIDYDMCTSLIKHTIVDNSGDVIEENVYLSLQDISNKLYNTFIK